jgi:hypothetical protein
LALDSRKQSRWWDFILKSCAAQVSRVWYQLQPSVHTQDRKNTSMIALIAWIGVQSGKCPRGHTQK